MTAPSSEVADRIVVADRYPASVVRPHGVEVIDQARAVLTRDELFVFAVRGDRVVEVERHPWQPASSELGRGRWRVATPVGDWVVERGSGCGCGSPLKRFVPWLPYRVGRL